MPQLAISAIQAMLAPVVLMTTSAMLAGGMHQSTNAVDFEVQRAMQLES